MISSYVTYEYLLLRVTPHSRFTIEAAIRREQLLDIAEAAEANNIEVYLLYNVAIRHIQQTVRGIDVTAVIGIPSAAYDVVLGVD